MASGGLRADREVLLRQQRLREIEARREHLDPSLAPTPLFCAGCDLEILRSQPWFTCVTCSSRKEAKDVPDSEQSNESAHDAHVYFCPICFAKGVETITHTTDHAYRVNASPAQPLLCVEWSTEEEIRLVEGVELNGVGNWKAIAEYIGSPDKTVDTIKAHYQRYYICNSAIAGHPRENPEVIYRYKMNTAYSDALDAALAERRAASEARNFDLTGYLPLRDAFDVEYEQTAEILLCDLVFTEKETQAMLERLSRSRIARATSNGNIKTSTSKTSTSTSSSNLNRSTSNSSSCSSTSSTSNTAKGKKRKTPSCDETTSDGEVHDEAWEAGFTRFRLNAKLKILRSYNEKLLERERRRSLAMIRNYIEWRERHRMWLRASRTERVVRAQLRPLELFSRPQQHEALVQALTREMTLGQRLPSSDRKSSFAQAAPDTSHPLARARRVSSRRASASARRRIASEAGDSNASAKKGDDDDDDDDADDDYQNAPVGEDENQVEDDGDYDDEDNDDANEGSSGNADRHGSRRSSKRRRSSGPTVPINPAKNLVLGQNHGERMATPPEVASSMFMATGPAGQLFHPVYLAPMLGLSQTALEDIIRQATELVNQERASTSGYYHFRIERNGNMIDVSLLQ